MAIEKVLQSVCEVEKEHIEFRDKQESGYNIYKILCVTENEVLMCRVLADLLNPQGSHNMGDIYLREFLGTVLGIDVSEKELLRAHVYKEYPITNDRRIDIVIQFEAAFLPIEVKINAGEQKSQCYDYFQYAKNKDKDTFVVYLTKYGHYPSKYSVTGKETADIVPEDKIHCISFKENIMEWLIRIKALSTEAMSVMIGQYIDAIKDFTENKERAFIMDIADKISGDSDSLRASIHIAKSIDTAKAKVITLLFREFERQLPPLLAKYNMEEETKSRWFHYEEQATQDFYAHNESTYPGLNYVMHDIPLKDGLSLWLRIEVEYRLFAGFGLFNYNLESEFGIGNQQDVISEEIWADLRKYIILPYKQESDSWMIEWRYLPTGSQNTHDDIEKVPDFKVMNEAAIELADEGKRVRFVEECIEIIELSLLKLVRRDAF